MSKRSDPDSGTAPSRARPRRTGGERLLGLAAAVADGEPVSWTDAGDDRIAHGLRVIANLSERMGAVAAGAGAASSRGPVLFQWGHLDVLERIGEGASSEVFRAYDPLLAVDVALKLSRPGRGWASTADWIAEARRLARLRHPNIVAVYGVDRHDGRAGIWLDLVEGETLQAWGERHGPLASRELCLLGIELCRGLAAIHDAGLLHCDLKPSNLLRDRDGRILITDFGAAASTQGGSADRTRYGTPLATAPEVLAGGGSAVASDLYGLGVVLYWLAAGRLPVLADSVEELLDAHRQRASGESSVAIPDHLEPGIADLIERLLAVDPLQRPASAAQAGQALVEALKPAARTTRRDRANAPGERPTRFDRVVAREAELAYLQQEYQRAAGGHALPVLLAGETGTGKSALVARFAEWVASQDGRLLRMTMTDHPAGPRLPVLLARAMDAETRSARLRTDDPSDVVRALGTDRPVVLCLDDLQHADDTERAWIRRLVAESRASTLLLVGLIRTQEGQAPDVGGLFGDGPVGVLRLQPFSAAQSETAMAELLGAPDYGHDLPASACQELHRLSGGNPFFLSELLRHLIASGGLRLDPGRRCWQWQGMPDSLPPSLELTALERCRALEPAVQTALDGAAVLGERFSLTRLASLLEIDVGTLFDRIGTAGAAGIVGPVGPSTFGFRHGLIQQTLYRAMPVARRNELHRRCVDLLRDAREPEDRLALSVHAECGGDPETAFAAGYAALFAGAGKGDTDRADPADYERLQALIDAGVRPDRTQRWRIVLGRIRALRNLGRLHEAQEVAEQVSELQPPAGGGHVDNLRLERAETFFALGEHRRVLVELAPILDPGDGRRVPARACVQAARLLAVRAQAALGDYREAQRSLEEVLSETGSRHRQLQVRSLYGWCLALQGHLEPADEALSSALALAHDADPAVRAELLRRQNWVKLGRGHYQRAYAVALAAHDAYRSIGDAMGQAKARMALAQVRLAQGLTEEAVGYLHRTAYELGHIGDRHCQAETLWQLAAAEILLGDLERADDRLHEALRLIAEIGDRDDEFRFLTEQARLRRAQGRLDAALADADQAAAIARELGSDDGVALADIEAASTLLAQGHAAAAAERCAGAARQLHALGAGESWRADWLLGRCHLALAQPAQAVAALAAAQATVERIIAEFPPSDHARRTRLRRTWQPLVDDHAAALDAAGHADDAARLLRRWLAADAAAPAGN